MSDATFRTVERHARGSEAHAVALARAGRSAEARAIYLALVTEARHEASAIGLTLQYDAPIAETRGPVVAEPWRSMAVRRKALLKDSMRLSRLARACA